MHTKKKKKRDYKWRTRVKTQPQGSATQLEEAKLKATGSRAMSQTRHVPREINLSGKTTVPLEHLRHPGVTDPCSIEIIGSSQWVQYYLHARLCYRTLLQVQACCPFWPELIPSL